MRPGIPFSYSCALTIVGATFSGKEEDDMPKSLFSSTSRHYAIPYQKLLLCNQEEEKFSKIMVPPGYKVWITGSCVVIELDELV